MIPLAEFFSSRLTDACPAIETPQRKAFSGKGKVGLAGEASALYGRNWISPMEVRYQLLPM
jgi:hypothetical protein